MKFQIRPCRLPDDLEVLTAMLHRAYAELGARGWRYSATHQTPEVTERRVRAGQCFIAEVDGALAGTITVKRPNPQSTAATYREEATFMFGQFGVDPAFRGQGIGRALHTHAVRFAEANGATAMALDTAVPAVHLIALYAKWGYREVERCQWGDTNYESVIMKKDLKRPAAA
jgi:GNAT superfamily N-acetyltransferase